METAERAEAERPMMTQARSMVLTSAQWLTAFQVAQCAGFSTGNPSKQLNQWKSESVVFSIQHDGVEYYPVYGFDENYLPLEVIAKLIKIFREKKSGWGIAYWCASPNSYLGGKRPQDLLITEPESVLNAAHWEAEGILHG